MDFAKIHRGVAYFGIGLEEEADSRGLDDALGILQAAIDETVDRDLRQDQETQAALAFIRQLMGRVSSATDFEKALTIQHSGRPARIGRGRFLQAPRRGLDGHRAAMTPDNRTPPPAPFDGRRGRAARLQEIDSCILSCECNCGRSVLPGSRCCCDVTAVSTA